MSCQYPKRSNNAFETDEMRAYALRAGPAAAQRDRWTAIELHNTVNQKEK